MNICICNFIYGALRHCFSVLAIHRGLGLAAEVGISVQYYSHLTYTLQHVLTLEVFGSFPGWA